MSQWQSLTAPSTSVRAPAKSKSRSKNHVCRPRNAFMIFRSEFWAQQRITGAIEHDHRHISRIIGHCWNNLPDEEKQVWRDKAEREKHDHSILNPNYKFKPVPRAHKPIKRQVKRNGIEELNRCRRVAELLIQGKQGHELETAVRNIDANIMASDASATGQVPATVTPPQALGWQPTFNTSALPAFRSPLLPPTQFPSPSHTPTIFDTSASMDPPPIALTPAMHQACQAVDPELELNIRELSEEDLLGVFWYLQQSQQPFPVQDLPFNSSGFDFSPLDAYAPPTPLFM